MQPVFTRKEKKVILFDFNDTLLDKQQCFYNAFAEALSEFVARLDGNEFDISAAVERYAKEWIKKPTATRRKRSASAYFEHKQLECLRKSLLGSPFPITESFLRSLLKRVKELMPAYPRLFPDVIETLEKLSGHYRLAIISNGSREKLETTLSRSGLKPMFPDGQIFVPSNRNLKKPHPDIFRRALTALEVSGAEAVMVGNSWKNDIFGANRCGIDTVWLQHKNKKTVQRKIGKNKVIFVSRCKQLLGLFELS